MDLFSVVAGITIVLIGLGMGTSTTLADFETALEHPKAVLIGFSSQYVFMPLCAFGMAKAFEMEDNYAVGLILVGCSPGGTLSNLFTYWSLGNVALSITMSFFSTVLAFGFLPLLAFLLLEELYGASVELPWLTISLAVALVVLPCAGGLALRRYNTETKIGPKFIWEWATLISSVLGGLFLVAAVAIVLAQNAHLFGDAPASLWICGALFEPLGFGFGFGVAAMLGISRRDCRTIALETGVQNVTLTLAILTLSYEGTQRDEASLFPFIYGIFFFVNSLWLVALLRYVVAPLDEETEQVECGPVTDIKQDRDDDSECSIPNKSAAGEQVAQGIVEIGVLPLALQEQPPEGKVGVLDESAESPQMLVSHEVSLTRHHDN